MKYLYIILISITGLYLSGCDTASNDANSVVFESVSKGTQSGIQNQRLLVIRNDSQLNGLWNEHTSLLSPVPVKPVIDFTNDILVAVFLGNTPTSTCLSILELTGAQSVSKSIIINVSIRVPSTTVTCLIAEQPFEIIKIQRVNNYIGFNAEVTEYDL